MRISQCDDGDDGRAWSGMGLHKSKRGGFDLGPNGGNGEHSRPRVFLFARPIVNGGV